MAQITIQSTTVPNYTRGGTAATLKVYATGPFFDSDGVEHVPGQSGIYKSVACTVSGTTVTIPAFTLPSTTDSSDDSVRYTAVLFDQQGGRVAPLMGGIEFFVSDINTTPTWAQVYTTNQATRRTMPDGFYTSPQTDFLLNLKQDALEDGVNIKTIAGNPLLGSGDLDLKTINGSEIVGTGDIEVAAGISGYTVENIRHSTTLDADSPTIIDDIIDALGTVIAAMNAADLMPGAPAFGTLVVDSQSRITTPWTAPTEGSTVAGYVLQRATNSSFTAGLTETALGDVLTYQSINLSPATQYHFRVAALDAAGNRGPWSTSATATTSAALAGPGSIASLWAYFEADSYSQADGSAITTDWTDKSGNARHATLAGPSTFQTSEFDSLQPAIDQPQFTLPSMAALTAGEAFFVVKLNSTGAGAASRVLQAMGGDLGAADLLFWNSGDSIFSDFGSSVRQLLDNPGAAVNDTNYHIVDLFSAANDWGGSVDGTAWTGTATNTVAFRAAPKIGYFNGGNILDGKIAAVYIFNAKLTAPQRATMLAYIREKYYLS